MSRFNRRSFFGVSLLGAGAALTGRSSGAEVTGNAAYPGAAEEWIIDDTSAVAETESGKVAGYIRGGVRVFMGIPYAEVRAPEGRWQRASKATPWAGKRSSRAQGPVCPQATTPQQMAVLLNGAGLDEVGLRDCDAQPFRPSEDCLRVNIWTPGLDNKKRQVLFWCHGGGFQNGFAMQELRLEAHNLAKYGDVVVVSINHRLNALGFLDLTAYGARYADSANLGMLDAIDALKWVRTNIANFGGDPQKVMIFGQSGGGAKVAALLSMPEAKGLFSRAVMQSPAPIPFATKEQGAARTADFFKALGIVPGNVEALHKLSADALMAAAGAAKTASLNAREHFDMVALDNDWRPLVDGKSVLHDPLQPNVVSDVPLLIGNNLHENYTALGHLDYAQMPEAQAREPVRAFFGPAGDSIYDVYKKNFPKAGAFEISAMSRAMGRMRAHCVKIAQRRAALKSAPTYSYWFHWQSGTFEGRSMSYHELEVPFVYLNTEEFPNATGGGSQARTLSLKMADAWLAFARTGNPNTKALPAWNPATPEAVSSMVFDNDCRIDHGSDMAAIEMFWKSRYPNG